jgi:hypothetical protein
MSTIEAPEKLNGDLDFAPVRVRFGPGRTQTMPLEWAECMLSRLRESQRKRFGDLLAEAALEGKP